MREEINILENNYACNIIELLKRKKMLGCKWFLTIKYQVNEAPKRHEARLVVKKSPNHMGLTIKKLLLL